MGLNIYFCDVCGVRVTDVDLRSGHGMRQARDVICATCLDMGHGSEWLASRGMSTQSKPLPAASHGVALLDAARDRASTVPETDERDQLDEDPTVEAHPQTQASGVEMNFASAASGMAALGYQRPQLIGADDGQLGDSDLAEADSSLMQPLSPVSKSDEHPASLFAPSSDEDESSALINVKAKSSVSSGSRATADVKRNSGRTVNPAGNRSNVSGSNPSKHSSVSSPQNRSASSKQNKTSSSRSTRAEKSGGLPLPLKISMITVPLILLIVYFSGVAPLLSNRKTGSVVDMSEHKGRIETSFKEASALVNASLGSHDRQKMTEARERWYRFQKDWEEFTVAAKQYSGWTDENCDQYWDGTLKAHDVQGRLKLINDELGKQPQSAPLTPAPAPEQ